VSPVVQPVEVQEPDLIDRIANFLPVEVRADYYREMRHCRSLPENDEMLRILRAMQFLTLLIHEAPARITVEREQIDRNMTGCLTALTKIEDRLEHLPEGLASSIGPEKVAAHLNESLRQQFVQTTIPQSAETLAAVATEIKQSVAEFAVSARQISSKHYTAATEAKAAIYGIEQAISSATKVAREANADLSRMLMRMNLQALAIGGSGLYLLGLLTGYLLFR
jgi:hypothetical protein